MSKAAVIHEFGPPEVFRIQDLDVGNPKLGEVRLRQTAIGVNFAEVRQRAGESYNFPLDELPIVLGREGAGMVEEVGADVKDLSVGDRVAYGIGGWGGYAETRLVPADRLVRLPDTVDDVTAAAVMVRGMTAWYLVCRAYAVQNGDWILLHAAAGGVGLILAQWAKHLGATVIGTVGSVEKAEIARSYGCDHTINYRTDPIAETVRELTGGKGVVAVYDSVGKDTFEASLDSLGVLGHFIMFGAASGDVDPIDPVRLMQKGSIHFTRTSMRHYTRTRPDLEVGTGALFRSIASDDIKVKVNRFEGLENLAAAHRALEARQLTGSTVVVL